MKYDKKELKKKLDNMEVVEFRSDLYIQKTLSGRYNIYHGKCIISRLTFESIMFQLWKIIPDEQPSNESKRIEQMGLLFKVQQAVLKGYEYDPEDRFQNILRGAKEFLKK